MTTETQAARKIIMESGSPFSSHSLNQDMIHRILDGERRVLGKPNSKAEKAEKKRQRNRGQQMTQGQPNTGSNGCEVTIADFTKVEIK